MPSLEVRLSQNSNPLITQLVFLVIRPHPEASQGPTNSHFITDTLLTFRKFKGFLKRCAENQGPRQDIFFVLEPGCLSSGCYMKMPQTGWLKQQSFTSQTSGGWEAQDPGAGRLVPGENPLPNLQRGTFSCFLTWQRKEERVLVSLPLCVMVLIPPWEPHPHDLI